MTRPATASRRRAPVDRELVERVHTAVVARLADEPGRDRLAPDDQRQIVLSWIQSELDAEARRRVGNGEPQLDPDTEQAVARAVENTVWGLGRIQALLDVRGVEDIHITGSDVPLLRMDDGSVVEADAPVADTDDDLVRQLQYIAAHHGSSERAFSPSQPCLNMQLPDGSRLAAMRDVVPRPVVTIRKHRLVDVGLRDLVRLGTVSPLLARFLAALVAARRSVLVTGMPACGKTTLLRALAREIDHRERFATLETEFELNLHRLSRPPPLLYAAECRQGSTERDPSTGRPAGEMTLTDLLHQTLRMSVTRVVVGEVRGAEALPMLEAMNAGMPGSMCTLHAGSAGEAFERLVTAAMKAAGSGWSDGFVTRLAAQGIDYVVHLRHTAAPRGGRARFVSEVAEVTSVGEAGGVAMNRIFAPSGPDPRAVFQLLPQDRRPFADAGVDRVPAGRSRRVGAVTAAGAAAALAGASLAAAVVFAVTGARRREVPARSPAVPAPAWLRRLGAVRAGVPARGRSRALAWGVAGVVVWAVSGWPVAGLAVATAGWGLPWLLGSGRVVQERIATLEALEAWCRHMADTLAGGGAIGLAQAITTTAPRVDEPIAGAVQALARRVQADHGDPAEALRAFADAVDDRTGDAVAAALLLALHQQSVGVAAVLRQLADGVARDVRARRDIEAARAESRQSIRMLLVIQAGLLVLLALTPSFAAPYGTVTGQVVMALLLGGTAALLVWMRRLALGRRPPRFFGSSVGAS